MAFADNEIFYKKLLWGIIGFFCLLFVIGLNVMHYEVLLGSQKQQKKALKAPPTYLYDISFTAFEEENQPRMIFLSEVQNTRYLEKVFSFLKEYEPGNIVLMNCANTDTRKLKQYLNRGRLIDAVCNADENNMEEMLAAGYNLVVLVANKNFVHHAALRAAERAGLKPHMRITEVKNGN